jgi:purine nucleosidase
MTEAWRVELIRPRARIISDNDYCGDPDGVVQLAHHLLCPSVEVRAVIGSAVGTHHPAWTETCAEDSFRVARRVAELAGREDVPILPGSSTPMVASDKPAVSSGAEAIVTEAMRTDTTLPLFMVCAGGLTTIASAYLLEPRIAEKITLVWNGGNAYDFDPGELPADVRYRETNISTDFVASMVVFNDSDIPIWQVPQDVFASVVLSRSEAAIRIRPHGALGAHIFNAIGERVDAWSQGLLMGETYTLGDCPLVLVTALGSSYVPEPQSCRWIRRPRPRILEDGLYGEAQSGRKDIRVFTQIDTRLLLEDLYAKLELHAAS